MAQDKNQLVDYTSLLDAHRSLAKEDSRIQAEINAFEDFLDQLDEHRPQPYRADGGTQPATCLSETPSSVTSQKAIQIAYRESVLAVDHWKDAYGDETTLESMANEFGVDVTAGLTGGEATWSPLLWDQLRRESEKAIETRQKVLQAVTAERQQLQKLRESLVEIGEELAEIERANYPFADRSDRLTTIHQRLEQLAEGQQAYLRQRETPNEELFPSFVYTELDTDHPGLEAMAIARDICDKIELRHWVGMR
ncbi:DUF7260 family protein [Haladaptatus sp. NG-WS-4]